MSLLNGKILGRFFLKACTPDVVKHMFPCAKAPPVKGDTGGSGDEKYT